MGKKHLIQRGIILCGRETYNTTSDPNNPDLCQDCWSAWERFKIRARELAGKILEGK